MADLRVAAQCGAQIFPGHGWQADEHGRLRQAKHPTTLAHQPRIKPPDLYEYQIHTTDDPSNTSQGIYVGLFTAKIIEDSTGKKLKNIQQQQTDHLIKNTPYCSNFSSHYTQTTQDSQLSCLAAPNLATQKQNFH